MKIRRDPMSSRIFVHSPCSQGLLPQYYAFHNKEERLKSIAIVPLIVFLVFSVPGSAKDNDRYRILAMNTSTQKPLEPGLWGGRHISLEITESGATLEFDCAHGTIKGKIVPGKDGKVLLKGTYVQERPGPVRQNDVSSGEPIELSGMLKGDKLRLTVRRPGSKRSIGTFTLIRGKEPFLVKCR
jgi:hypothetical protein